MKKILFTILCLYSVILTSQDNKHYKIIDECLENQIQFELQSSNITQKNVYLLDKPIIYSEDKGFYNLQDIVINNVRINFISPKVLKKKSKKGVNILKVYPFRIDENNGSLYVLIEMVNIKRKHHKLIGKSTYYFKYDCNKKKYILDYKVQNIS
jgi:hypothetical protein